MKSGITSFMLLFISLPSLVMGSDYVTTGAVRIYEHPDERAHIILDLPRFRKIVFDPVNRNWAKVVAVGTRRVDWCLQSDSGKFSDGKYVPSVFDLCEKDEMFPQLGFVQIDRVAPFPPEPPPLPAGGYLEVEQFWREWGIYDDRKLVVDIERHPFNAIVRVLRQGTERQPNFGPFKWSRDELLGLSGCSGAFVYAKNIVLTADHCIKNHDASLTVRVERAHDRYEDIQARVIAHGKRTLDSVKNFRGNIGDWAVLRLDREPRLPVEPLDFAEQIDWSATAAYHGFAVGYPADMFAYSRNTLGFLAPVLSACRSSMVRYEVETTEIIVNSTCDAFYGNSGGPLLVWQPTVNKFGIMGVASSSYRTAFGGLRAFEHSEHQRKRLLLKVNSFYPHQFSEKGMTIWSTDSLMYFIPGISKLFSWDESSFDTVYSMGKGAMEALRTATKLPVLGSDYWEDRRHLGFFFLQSDKPVGIPGSLRTLDFKENGDYIIKDVVEVRKQCASTCDRGDLDPSRQQPWTYGDILDRTMIRDLVRSGKAGYIKLSAGIPGFYDLENRHKEEKFKNTKFLAPLTMTDKPAVLHLMTGDDLFIIDRKDFSVIGVQRNIMNLRREGVLFNESFSQRHTPRDPATGLRRILNVHDGIGEDFGVEPTRTLRSENFGQPTPLTIPGGTLINTQELRDKLRSKTPPVVIAAMNDPYGLPGAIALDYAANAGTFDDATQPKLATVLNQLTGGDKHKEIVIYCHHSRCWLSYNATLRLARLGYTNLRWYRGGVETWIEAGLELDEAHQLANQGS